MEPTVGGAVASHRVLGFDAGTGQGGADVDKNRPSGRAERSVSLLTRCGSQPAAMTETDIEEMVETGGRKLLRGLGESVTRRSRTN